MLRTAAKDQNYLSLNEGSIVWFAGTDQEHEESGPLPVPLELVPENPKQWDSILKCSKRHNTIVRGAIVAQGKENALDINNESSVLVFEGQWGIVGNEGEQVITVKGGSHDIRIAGPVFSSGREADLEIGAWSDQSSKPCYNLDFADLYHGQGRQLTVKLGRVKDFWKTLVGAKTTIVLPKDCKVLVIKSLLEYTYWWGKFMAIKLGFFG